MHSHVTMPACLLCRHSNVQHERIVRNDLQIWRHVGYRRYCSDYLQVCAFISFWWFARLIDIEWKIYSTCRRKPLAADVRTHYQPKTSTGMKSWSFWSDFGSPWLRLKNLPMHCVLPTIRASFLGTMSFRLQCHGFL